MVDLMKVRTGDWYRELIALTGRCDICGSRSAGTAIFGGSLIESCLIGESCGVPVPNRDCWPTLEPLGREARG